MRNLTIVLILAAALPVSPGKPGEPYVLTGEESSAEEIVRRDMWLYPELYKGETFDSYYRKFVKTNRIGKRRFRPGDKLVFPPAAPPPEEEKEEVDDEAGKEGGEEEEEEKAGGGEEEDGEEGRRRSRMATRGRTMGGNGVAAYMESGEGCMRQGRARQERRERSFSKSQMPNITTILAQAGRRRRGNAS